MEDNRMVSFSLGGMAFEYDDVPNKKSELFELDNWTYHYTPMGEMFACIEGEVCQLDDEN